MPYSHDQAALIAATLLQQEPTVPIEHRCEECLGLGLRNGQMCQDCGGSGRTVTNVNVYELLEMMIQAWREAAEEAAARNYAEQQHEILETALGPPKDWVS